MTTRETTEHAPEPEECWCGCGEPVVGEEPDSGDPAAEACMDYATDDDGDVYCACDPRVEDRGEWTGGGPQGCGTAWVSRLVVRGDDEAAR